MSVLIRLIKNVKEEILKFENEYEIETPLSDIIKDKQITYNDTELEMNFSTEQILKALKYYELRGRNELVFCISVPPMDYKEEPFDNESLRDHDFLKKEALSLKYTYEHWINEEENKYYRREQKKNESIEFLQKYYPEVFNK